MALLSSGNSSSMRWKTHVYAGSALVAVLSVLFFLAAAALLLRDVYRTYHRPGSEPPAITIARENLKMVNDPANGWLPYGSLTYGRDPVYDWESDRQGWLLESEAPELDLPPGDAQSRGGVRPNVKAPTGALTLVNSRTTHVSKALSVRVHFPDPVTIVRPNPQSEPYRMSGVRFIAYDVFVPGDCPGYVGCLYFMKDKDGLWYQARSRAALLPGQWTTVTADIRGGSPDVTPLGHLGQWDDNQATQIKSLGLTFYGDREFNGTILIDNFRGWVRASQYATAVGAPLTGSKTQPAVIVKKELLKAAEEYKEPPLRVLNLRTDPPDVASVDGRSSTPAQVPKFETLTVRFELNRQVNNPFDPKMADITCEVITPSKKKLTHYGFWYQDYDRTDRFAGDELAPIGRPEWRVRITPREVGVYTYTITINLRNSLKSEDTQPDKLSLPARTFTAIPSTEK